MAFPGARCQSSFRADAFLTKETLRSGLDHFGSSIAKLTEEIAGLTKAAAEYDASVAQATPVREEEKAKNAVTIKDSRDAQTAMAQALSMLEKFWENILLRFALSRVGH